MLNITNYKLDNGGSGATFDGIFWMAFDDFKDEFARLDVCRIFDLNIWHQLPVLRV
jgi:hypothetical protein